MKNNLEYYYNIKIDKIHQTKGKYYFIMGDFKYHIIEYNNSLVELLLEIEINIQIILPFTSEKTTIKKKIPISTKIIQGKIPEYYGGMIIART